MKRIVLNASAAAATLAMFAGPAAAQSRSWWWWWGGWSRPSGGGNSSSSVPEIDASTGLLAMAAVGAALLLAWEIKRRKQRG